MNAGAPLIFSSLKFQHITPLLRQLYWLRAPERIAVSSRVCTCIPYRRALSGGRCRGSSATSFQFILITDCQLHPTVYRRRPSFSDRRCLRLGHSLPDLVTSAPSVAVFRSRLKTHLFNISATNRSKGVWALTPSSNTPCPEKRGYCFFCITLTNVDTVS